MLAGQIREPGRIELVEAREPELGGGAADGAGEIIFQPERACLCGSDMPFFRGDLPRYPLEPGYSLHEMIGKVVATNGERFREGDRVLAVPVMQRGFFERYRVSEKRAIPLDPRPPAEEALLAQPLGTVLFALRKTPAVLGLDVAIVGQGPIGQLFAAALRRLGARRIIALDRIEARLRVSPVMGASDVVHVEREDPVASVAALTGDRMADLVIEAAGHRELALNLCADLCREGGRILFFGVPPETIDGLQGLKIFLKNLTIQTSVNPDFDVDFPLAMRWISEARIDVTPLITHRFPLARSQEAFETCRDRRDGALKVFIEFPGPH